MAKQMPDWPRRMQSELAAAYVGLSKSKFLRDVGSRWPEGVRDGGNLVWYREDLDAVCDSVKPGGGASVNPYEAALGGD